MSILTTLENLASHMAVETATVKPTLSSTVYDGRSCFILPKPFQKLVQIHTGAFIQSTSGSFDETMLFTIVVSASGRSSLILLVVELTKAQRGCNSSLSRKQFYAGKRAHKDLIRDILNSKNQWLNSLRIVSTISKQDAFKFKLSLSL